MDPRLQWALKQSTRHSMMLLGKLNSKVLKWYADGNFSAIFAWISKRLGSKSKVGFVADAAANIIRSIEPYLKDLNSKQLQAVEEIRQKMRNAQKELPEVKKAGKEYQAKKQQERTERREKVRQETEGKMPYINPYTHKVEWKEPKKWLKTNKTNGGKDNNAKQEEKEVPKGLQNPEIPQRDKFWRYP